jgi:hypothetical protein
MDFLIANGKKILRANRASCNHAKMKCKENNVLSDRQRRLNFPRKPRTKQSCKNEMQRE